MEFPALGSPASKDSGKGTLCLYLFILVADVLQLIQQSSRDGLLQHPIVNDCTCPVLQYADDTLIVLRGELDQVPRLKVILDNFSSATGLHINFSKSTFLPMHIEDDVVQEMASILGCTVSSFPQAYLGLLLSTIKLRPEDMICSLSYANMTKC
uniref:Reverse transcriptase domain-containing protein n=1 Tax=Arundo donax TaxID=35708 RepID=A0A0A9EF20_ARUDO